MMKEFADFYFDGGGWLVASGLGFFIGVTGGMKWAIGYGAFIASVGLMLMHYRP